MGISPYYNKEYDWGRKAPQKPISMQSSLDTNQQVLADSLQKMLSGIQSPDDYLSGLTSFLSKAQNGGIAGPLKDETESALKRAMSGEVSEDYWNDTVVNPTTKTLKRDILPGIKEASVGPGTYWGGARSENVSRGYTDLADSIAAARGSMANESLNRAATTALGYSGQISANVGNWINAFIAANPSYTDTINSILAYLNTPTQVAYQNPEYIPEAIQKVINPNTMTSSRIPAGGAY